MINNHFEIVKLLVESGFNIRATCHDKQTPFIYACRKGNLKIAEYLFEKDSLVDQKDERGRTALFYAAKNGYLETCKFLIEKGFNVNQKDNKNITPLQKAKEEKNYKICELLIENGAKTD